MKKLLYLILALIMAFPSQAQRKKKSQGAKNETITYDEKLYNGLEYRSIGPYRGGRAATATGVPHKPNLFYFGSTGGGVWRTMDGGNTWENISDGFFGGSIGAVAVSEWDNNVIYVGGGEVTVRGNVSAGSGVWKSLDAGETWSFAGLPNSRQIPCIRIHPKNPDVVYAAVLGDLFKSSADRGVYRSTDGGKNWDRILFANADAGAVDLCMDPNNPRILFASTWRIRRTPYSLESGGEGSDLWKSTDGGDTWKKISKNPGLPSGIWGTSGVSVSPANSNRVYAIIENQNGGVFRSDDGGKTWQKTNEDRSLRQRAWYYSRIIADTQDEDGVYVMNVSYHHSKDGGKSFKSMNAPHGDHHGLWIAPEDNQRMIICDDGGGQVSYDGGNNWSTYNNQPTAQFYRVTTDNNFPYRIYGAQQDNSTVRILHRTDGRSIGIRDWEPTAGGESGHIAIDPTDLDVVYGGSYDGYLIRQNHRTGEERSINVWPDLPMGHGAEGMRYRFQWNFPIFFSPHENDKLYAASNVLHVTRNGGESWEIISPDLTRNDPSKLGPSGGPITKDNTAVEYYCTIFAAGESPYEKDLIVAGSDDGLLHITTDAGKNWKLITPPQMPEWSMINSIEFDPFNKGGIYLAATRYKLGDYLPYLYHSKDYGQTWQTITNGIDKQHFTRVVRCDPHRAGLLYAGTENGVYISFDDGASWKPFQLNLPIVPITDITIKNDNLIVATQGRSFWLIDDLTPLHQLNDQVAQSSVHLYKPLASYRMEGGVARTPSKTEGQNHPNGVMIHFYLKDTTNANVTLEILEMDKTLIRKFTNHPDKEHKKDKLEIKPGMNRHIWNMRYADAEGFDNLIMWSGSLTGPKAVPGKYLARLTVDGREMETTFEILKDPRTSGTLQDIKEQFEWSKKINQKLTVTHQNIKKIRKAREQMNQVTETIKDDTDYQEVNDAIKTILDKMKTIEEALYQTKNQSRQDPLNFPVRLNNKLAALTREIERSDYRPTKQVKEVYQEINGKIDDQLTQLKNIFDQDVPNLNELIRRKQINPIIIQ